MAKAARKHHVIVGASAAGLAALEAIREVDKDCAVTVVSKEKGPLYSRVGLTHFLDRTVKLSNRRTLKYDTLLVATGSSALILPIPGAKLRGVHPCMTRNDAVSIDRVIPKARQVPSSAPGSSGSRRLMPWPSARRRWRSSR